MTRAANAWRRTTLILVAAATSWLSPGKAAADAHASGTEIVPGIGAGLAHVVNKGVAWDGWVGQGSLRLEVPGHSIAPRLDVVLQRYELKRYFDTAGDTGPFRDASLRVMSLVPELELQMIQGDLEPYLFAGVGAHQFRLDDGQTPRTRFGVTGGVGIRWRMGAITGSAEARLDNVYAVYQETAGHVVQLVPVTLGVTY